MRDRYLNLARIVATCILGAGVAACAVDPNEKTMPAGTPTPAPKSAPASQPSSPTSPATPTSPTSLSTPAHSAEPGTGIAAADFTLQDADGKTVQLSDYKGKVVVLDFWATWCPPCRAEIPGFIALQSKYKTKGVEVIGVSLDDGWAPVRPFMSKQGMNYTVVLGDQKLVAAYGGFTGIPTTFVIDRNGVVRSRHEGYGPPEFFEKAIAPLL